MKLQQLETFFWTVRLGSFAAAADRLNATHSAVSMRLRELERHFGTELFDRSHRTARLTPKGRELMEYASRILDLSTEVEHRMKAPDTISGVVRFGVAEVVTTSWLPALITLIATRYPNVQLEIEEALTSDLMRSLDDGALELILAPGHTNMANAATLSLGTVEFVWMASPALKLEKRPYRAAELAQWPIIGLKQNSFHYATIENMFQREHARYRYLARCKSLTVVASMAMAGMGISYLPRRSYEAEIARGRLQLIEVDPPLEPVEFIAAFSLGHSYSLARAVAELAQNVSTFDKRATVQNS